MLKEAGTIEYVRGGESDTLTMRTQHNQMGDLLHQAADVIEEEI